MLQLKKNLSPEWPCCCSALRHYGAKFKTAGYQDHIFVSNSVEAGCLSASVWLCEGTTTVLQILVQVTLALMSHRLDTLPPFELVVVTQVVLHC